MSTSPKPKPQASWTVMLTVGILAAVAGVFVIAFALSSQPTTPDTPVDDTKYVAEVTALLANADAARGEELVTTKYECGACHIQGAGKTAPGFEGLSERAASEHPPLTAEAYIYESLLHPPDHIVEGYANAMPANYGTRLTPEELGDIIAYLLTQ